MKRIFFFGSCLVLLPACGSGNPTPVTPPVPSGTAVIPLVDAGPLPTPIGSAAPDAGATSEPSAGGSENPACGGSDIALADVLANKKCRATPDAPPTPPSAVNDVKVTLTAASTTVKAHAAADLTLTLTNTSTAPVPLYFSGDMTLEPEVRDAKGNVIEPPKGNAPKNADPKCSEQPCRLPESHVVLAPGGKATAHVAWIADKVAWPKVGPTTCCTFHVAPESKGALSPGKYKVKIPLPYESKGGNPADPELEITVTK